MKASRDMSQIRPLSPEQLYRVCDIQQLDFKTTAELHDLGEILGQARALEAIHFGIGIKKQGYNLYALGPAGTGKNALVTQLLTQKARDEAAPSDWIYVNDFAQAHKPKAIQLPRGYGARLRQDMQRLIEELRTVIPSVFESDEYRAKTQEFEDELKEHQEATIDEIRSKARQTNIALIRTPGGFSFAPMEGDEVISPKEFQKLSSEQKEKIQTLVDDLQEDLRRALNQIPQWQREARDKLKALNRDVTISAVGHLIDELRMEYHEFSAVQQYLNDVQDDVVANVDDFRRGEDEEATLLSALQPKARAFRRYEINVLVDHGQTEGAPVVFEDSPTYQNLIGRIEHLAMMGALITDFTLIKSGALHRANNGYLVLECHKLLQHPFSWEALKRALRSAEVRMGTLEQMLSLVSTVSLEPEPIPLNVKVVLLGDRILYYLLCQYDPDFKELFKVAADFEDSMDRNDANNQLYANVIASLIKKEELQPFDRSAVARVIEHSSRIAGDAEKLTTHMRSIADLLTEAEYWAQQAKNGVVGSVHVQQAIDAQFRRGSRILERMQESIRRGFLLIDTAGEKIGQVNGLTVMELGDVSFGLPTRITASVRMGDGEVIDIEREVELAGPLHSKGVLILSGFLGRRYAQEKPLALSASLVFEQSYGEVEGDSASSAELYALLSALAEVPIKQGLAVTGSVNQNGEIQAIGGVNEKIEGFFDVCQQRGLDGTQGVLIPLANVKDLMLRHDVVTAVSAGKFNIYSVSSVDEGIELLTGMEAGILDVEENYPEKSINGRAMARVAHFAEIRHEFAESKKDGDD
jgi:lon-related putative ATP-dependent protease